jgi:hypothetical protein
MIKNHSSHFIVLFAQFSLKYVIIVENLICNIILINSTNSFFLITLLMRISYFNVTDIFS